MLRQKVIAIIKNNESKIKFAMMKSESQLPLAMKEIESSFMKAMPMLNDIASQV